MRPHIVKRLDLWWCGYPGGNLIRNAACHTTPQGAYASWERMKRREKELKARQLIQESIAAGMHHEIN